jgi:hypothetical protein
MEVYMVYLARKEIGGGNVQVVHHTSLAALQAEGLAPEREVPDAEFEAAGCIARIIGDEIVIGKTDAEKSAEDAAVEIERIKSEIQSRDYRALKAQKLGEDLDDLYPGESEWYRDQLDRIGELEAVIAAAS